MEFSKKVKQAMAIKKINASELARQMGYSPKHVLDLLASKRRWNEETMAKACNVLNIKVVLSIAG